MKNDPKRYAYAVLYLLQLVAFSVLIACAGRSDDPYRYNKIQREFPEIGSGWMKAAENDFSVLQINRETAAIALTDRASGKIWRSNPDEDDPLASAVNNEYLKSQFRITYYNEGAIRKSMNSYSDSVRRGQFEIMTTEKGADVVYSLGDVADILLIPFAISAERFDMFYERITDSRYLAQLDRQFTLITLEKAKNEEERYRLLETYPQLRDHDFYKFSELDNKAVLERIEAGFIQAGYTLDDLIFDHRQNNVPEKAPNYELFSVTVHYELDGDVFRVRIPTDEILYHPSFPLTSIRVLEYFGASAMGENDGYIFVPDGSGAIIMFDNGRKWADGYYGRVYGADPAVPLTERGMIQSNVCLPVFGMKQDGDAFLAVVEEGDAFAGIYADISGRLNSYNNAGSEFTILPMTPVSLEGIQGNKYINAYQKGPFPGEIRIAYRFLHGSDANYSGMARLYSDQLFCGDRKESSENNAAFLLDFYMAIDKKKQVLGIPYRGIDVLTDYKTLTGLVNDLKNRGAGDFMINLYGWTDGGYLHYPSLRRETAVGSGRDMNAFIDFTRDEGIPLYFDASITRVLRNGIFDWFNRNRHSVRLLDRTDAFLYPINAATNTPDETLNGYYLLGPKRGEALFDKVLKRSIGYGLPGISFRYAGNSLHSDFFERDQVSRSESEDILRSLLGMFKENGFDVMVHEGFAYALPFADTVTDLALTSNDFFICDAAVPFLPMVLNGRINYTGNAVNLHDASKINLMRHLETGAIPRFSLIGSPNSRVVHTHYEFLFSVNYSDWIDQILAWASSVRGLRNVTEGTRIRKHEILAPDVSRVTYENGTKIIFNFSVTPYEADGVRIAGEDFYVFGK